MMARKAVSHSARVAPRVQTGQSLAQTQRSGPNASMQALRAGARHAALPLADEARPARPPDVYNGHLGAAWIEGAEWMYGGVGYCGFNTARAGGGCDCWHSRFAADYFNRTFAPEIERYTVAVLDSNGNLILRIGRYGNVEDGMPQHTAGGPVAPRPLGGDEVALFHAAYVGLHSDRRLFISDAGNARILSVRLDYHATEKVALRDVPDKAER